MLRELTNKAYELVCDHEKNFPELAVWFFFVGGLQEPFSLDEKLSDESYPCV